MKKLHSFIKHLVAILLGTALVGMSVYAVQIPTSLNNALQYIMETVWTSNGTSSGTVNVDISTGGIYIATGFLQNGNAWNNMSLGLDSSGNVVYVPGGSSTPIFSLASNFIPKLDALGTSLELSVMYQTGGLIGVNTTVPTRSVDILGDFLVETQGVNVTYKYNFINSNTGLGYPPVDIGTAPRCSCDVNANIADCSVPFFNSVNDQGYYCVDLTVQNNGNYYDHNVYVRQTIGIPSPVLSTSGLNVGVRTNNPQAALDVEDGSVLFSGTNGTTPGTGPGTRFAWAANKAALRAGVVNGTMWDDANIGYNSIALGENTIASGAHSFAGGQGAQALNDNTFVWNNTGTFASTTSGQFLINAYGGMGVNTNTNLYKAGTSPLFAGGISVNGFVMSNASVFARNVQVYDTRGTGINDIFDPSGDILLYNTALYTGANSKMVIQGNNGLFGASTLDVVINPYGGGRGGPQANVGIGMFNPQFKLDVNGTVRGIGPFNQTSDGKYKTNEAPIANALNKITSLNGISYVWDREKWPDINFDNRTHLGFIAQDVEPIIPEAVSIDDDGNYSMAYTEIIPVLVEAMKEQQTQITNLQAQIDVLTQYNVTNP